MLTLDYGQQVLAINEGLRCLTLWRAVIARSFVDVTFNNCATKEMKKEAFRITVWTKTDDFKEVCFLANVDPVFVAEKIHRVYLHSLEESKKPKVKKKVVARPYKTTLLRKM